MSYKIETPKGNVIKARWSAMGRVMVLETQFNPMFLIRAMESICETPGVLPDGWEIDEMHHDSDTREGWFALSGMAGSKVGFLLEFIEAAAVKMEEYEH